MLCCDGKQRAMASKSQKRARLDAPVAAAATTTAATPTRATKDQPSARRRDPPSAADSDAAAAAATDAAQQLRAELESARKCIEQLRREKDYERRQVRDEEQARACVALKEQAARLHVERQRELDDARETMRLRQDADAAKVARQHELAMRRLRDDLERCQNELREEVEKRGVSTSVRAGYEAERARLIKKVADLSAAKRRLDEALQSATEADKQKAAEIRRLQDAGKQEVARVSKDANAEIRKLLEELKAKDHQLALQDRNQYPDKGVGIGKLFQSEISAAVQPAKDVETGVLKQPKPPPPPTELQSQVLRTLRADAERLTGQLAASENDKNVLRARLEELRCELNQRNEVIANLQSSCQNKDKCIEIISEQRELKQGILSSKSQQKAVRFLLPGCTLPVLARETPTHYDDELCSISSEVSDVSSLSTCSTMSADTTTFCDGNIEQNYHLLLTEYLQLQRSVALVLSSWTPPALASSSSATTTTTATATMTGAMTATSQCTGSDKAATCSQDCNVKIESMKVAIETLKDKLYMCEETERNLRLQLQEQLEQNEEMEFRVFELEDCAEKCKSNHCHTAANDLIDNNDSLGEEISSLKLKLTKYEALEKELLTNGTSSSLHEFLAGLRQQRTDLENQLNILRSELNEVVDRMNGCTCSKPQNPTIVVDPTGQTSLASEKPEQMEIERLLTTEDNSNLEDDRFGVMTCSISSTTSGFDDNSCASSVADKDEMPSEETWGFEVEEFCSELNLAEIQQQASKTFHTVDAPVTDSSSSSQTKEAEVITDVIINRTSTPIENLNYEDTQQAEKSYAKRLEKLEKRLLHSLEGEQRARDQLALVSEEKDRRIAVLEDQVDMLEASEFRLTKTIDSLEQLERAFSSHFLDSSVKDSSLFDQCKATSETDHCEIVTLKQIEKDEGNLSKEDAVVPLKEGSLVIGHPCNIEGCTQCHACQMLKSTIEQLHSAVREHADFDRRVRELESTEPGCREAVASAAADDTLQEVDFEAEYRELEALVRELKKVLVDERQQEKEQREERCSSRGEISDGSSTCARVSGRSSVMSTLSVDAQNDWQIDDDSFSMPASPASELDSASVAALTERNRELEITEQYLHQQISDLEIERRQLREILHNNETTIRDLDIHVVELQGSEDALRQDVGRLRAKEDWMNRRIDDLMELVARLEDAVKGHQMAESELRSRLERHQTIESDLSRELENALDEMHGTESKFRRWISQLEYEKETLIGRMDDLLDKNMELESREAALACKIRKMEVVEIGLRNEIAELERALSGVKGAEICEEHLLMPRLDVGDRCRGLEDTSRIRETMAFMQQSLQNSKRSNLALETKLRESAASEHVLRGTITEYEKIDKIWQEKVEALQTSNKELAEKLEQLNEQMSADNVQRCCNVTVPNVDINKSDQLILDDSMGVIGNTNVSPASEKLSVNESIAAALKSILLLSDVADDVDDTELVYWAAVEGGILTGNELIEEDVSSPYWADVETHMGLIPEISSEVKAADEIKTFSYQSSTVPLAITVSDNQNPTISNMLPPPLPLSPPPMERGFDRDLIGSSLSVDLLADDQRLHPNTAATSSDKKSSSDSAARSTTDVENVHTEVGLRLSSSHSTASENPPISNRKLFVVSSNDVPRSRSADFFRSELSPSTADAHQNRASSENREVNEKVHPTVAFANVALPTRAAAAVTEENHKPVINEHLPVDSEGQKSLADIKERSHKARQFWAGMSSAGTPSSTAALPRPPPVPERPSSFRPSLIPRSTSRQLSFSDDNGSTSPRSPVSMPVIRSANVAVGVESKAERKPRSSPYTTVLTSNRSFIPRLVNENGNSPQTDDKPSFTVSEVVNSDKSSGPTISKYSYPYVSLPSSKGYSDNEQKLEPSATDSSSTSQQQQPQLHAGFTCSPDHSAPGRRE